MKKLILILLLATLFTACKKDEGKEGQRVSSIIRRTMDGSVIRSDSYQYDEGGKIVRVIVYDSSRSIDEIKVIYSGEKIELKEFYLNEEVGSKEIFFEGNVRTKDISTLSGYDSKLQKEYYYNNRGDIDSIMYSSVSSTDTHLSVRDVFNFENGNLTEISSCSFTYVGTWQEYSRKRFHYSDTLLQTVQYLEKMTGANEWYESMLITYSYQLNKLTSIHYELPQDWQLDDTYIYTCNESGLCTGIKSNLDITDIKYETGTGNYQTLFCDPEGKYYQKYTAQ